MIIEMAATSTPPPWALGPVAGPLVQLPTGLPEKVVRRGGKCGTCAGERQSQPDAHRCCNSPCCHLYVSALLLE